MEFTYEEVFEAYIKLKTYIYYDSTNLFMRKQLAIFETDLTDGNEFINRYFEYSFFEKEYDIEIDQTTKKDLSTYERKLKVFVTALNKFHEDPKYFDRFLGRIKPKYLPKKIQDSRKNSRIISNKRKSDKYVIERSTVFIDAPIEIHLISVLWILKNGVNLDKDLFEGCLGNRLILNKEKDKVVQGSGLFKPYPKQYQKWRDDAVKAAQEQLTKKEDVLIVNLDIRDFFYSVRLNKQDIDGTVVRGRGRRSSQNNLYKIFGKIHEVFTEQLAEHKTPYDFKLDILDGEGNVEKYILPIGLLSSFVIANDHLKEFDKRILKHSRPIYYGRYVDDVLIVISNPKIPDDNNDKIIELNFHYKDYLDRLYENANEILSEPDFANLLDVEQYVLLNFHPLITLIDKPSFLCLKDKETPSERVFKLNGFNRLYCQSDKTLLYYFDKSESALVMDKLKRDLEEKSSEFRNYSDTEDTEDFEESAYHLLYDGTEGKVRTLKDYKEDKFGLTVYLSKRIFNSLRRADKISNLEVDKIVKFFQGSNALSLYTLWERIFVFLLVNNKAQAYVEFYLNCCEAIKRIELPDEMKKEISIEDYQSHVLEHLDSSNELALSLYPQFLSEVQSVKRTYDFSFNALKNDLEFYKAKYNPIDENSFFISRYRRSNLIRHHYVAQPLMSYTETYQSDYKNYTDLKIHFK